MATSTVYLDFEGKDSGEIRDLLRTHQLSLTPEEALKIQREILGRPPALAECVLWSIQGSEHCSYKSSRTHLKQFVSSGPNVILGPSEDAGVVEVGRDAEGRRWGLALSHESHNHPSQIVPYEGAATGVGGNVRDVCCMGAKVIAVGDSLRFGNPSLNKTKWIQDGVIAGIGGYGNPLGIPNLAGDVQYDEGYNENCLVTVFTMGVLCEDHLIHSHAPADSAGYALILVGKPTDNSGFGGASFASGELEEEAREQNKGAVQEPNAFLGRHLLKATYALVKKLSKEGLIDRFGFKDLGAGGVACASVELADGAGLGAEVDLEQVHVSMENLPPHVILCSETQERYMWVVPPEHVDWVLEHYNQTFDLPGVSVGAAARVIGRIRPDQSYKVNWKGETLIDARAPDVTQGLIYDRPAQTGRPVPKPPSPPEMSAQEARDLLKKLLAHENVASREPIYESYDKQVQGGVVIEAGQADAGVLKPFFSSEYPPELQKIGVAVSMDQNPRFNRVNPYWGAVQAVLESARNVAAVGASPIAFTDCLCYGNPEKPAQMADFIEGIRGVAEAAQGLSLRSHPGHPVPIVAGNVSLYNESRSGGIPPSPMIACVGHLPDASRAITPALKEPGSRILALGTFAETLGGSLAAAALGIEGGPLHQPDPASVNREIHQVVELIDEGLFTACHDVAEGGLAVALAEMALAGSTGFKISIPENTPLAIFLFAEGGGFVAEVPSGMASEVEKALKEASIPWRWIGETLAEPTLRFGDAISLELEEARDLWENGLRKKMT